MTNTTLWLIAGAALIALELFTTTFYLLAIAAGFLAAAAASALSFSSATQLLIASVVSLLASYAIKQWKKNRTSTEIMPSDDIGKVVQIEAWLDERHARIHYRGSHWDAVLAPDCKASDTETWYISASHGTQFEISNTPPQI
ncbi:NfeD family protein [Chitinibacter sp. GC72]|uniref:NfeD family protein n=1 Tax=Chitinibacter sp. GC72 TaxID=1526917 RepID=UPI0012F859D6|nr:NfeD family protein [Chitinibacter sp. GC72]